MDLGLHYAGRFRQLALDDHRTDFAVHPADSKLNDFELRSGCGMARSRYWHQLSSIRREQSQGRRRCGSQR